LLALIDQIERKAAARIEDVGQIVASNERKKPPGEKPLRSVPRQGAPTCGPNSGFSRL